MSDSAATADGHVLELGLLLDQARSYLDFGERLRQCAARLGENAADSADWGELLQQNFAQFRAALDPSMTDATVPGAESDPQLARLWAATFATWQQTLSALGAAVPVLEGVTTRAGWPHYLQVQDDYLGLLQAAAREALDILQQRLEQRQAAGETVSGLRDLYNLWVACNEETYGRMLRGEHYARLVGHLLNALLACCPRPGDVS